MILSHAIPVSDPLSATSDEDGRSGFRTHLRPRLAKLLAAIGLDVVYTRGEGDFLTYRDDFGRERVVLDMLGGYGAALFGHNHPELVARAHAVLAARRPFVAQASVRPYAGLLGERLSTLLGRATGQDYVVTLANSGTEAVEAAIKHAELERNTRLSAFFDRQRRAFSASHVNQRSGQLQVGETFLCEAARLLDVPAIADLDALEFHLTEYNRRVLMSGTCYLAVQGSFHGKSSGALKLTHSPDFRRPWHGMGLDVHFVPRGDEERLRREMEDAEASSLVLRVDEAGGIALEEERWSRLVACVAEPIQSEGGIHELPPEFMAALRRAANRAQVPLILDEIQSGMGRTGAFLASEHAGVAGDYYLLSKALGGGLAKIAALLVRRDRYQEEFGYLHTSTFADDDFSSAISLAALDLVTRDNGALMRGCHEKGEYLLERLSALQQRYPRVIQDVRGRGLLLGVELAPMGDSASNLMRVASEQHLLGGLVSGYLLHEEDIRVAWTLSTNNTIRLEPSAYISYPDLDRFCESFERAVVALDRADARLLVRGIAGDRAESEQGPPSAPSPSREASSTSGSLVVDRRVACLCHYIDPQHLLHWDPTLEPLSPQGCSRLLARVDAVLDPFVADERVVHGPSGERVALVMIGLPWTAEQIMARVRGGELRALREKIENAVDLARQEGCTLAGFAGYTSIVTDNCRSLAESRIGLTTGNSLTAAAALDATRQVAVGSGISSEAARVGIVGALGNIGRVLAEIEADRAASLLLVGRPGGERRLLHLADELYERAWGRLHGGMEPGTLGAELRAEVGTPQTGDSLSGSELRCLVERSMGDQAPIRIATDLAQLRDCDVIYAASNSPQPVLGPEHVGDHPTVVCDVAVPSDVRANLVRDRSNVRLLRGGIVRLPAGQDFSLRGMVLADGQSYACVAEVVLLGLAGVGGNFSYGSLSAQRVREVGVLARQFGFTFEARH
jgi:acetylornithine/succinyldiaminopimelate/putrescine aminotransferase/predicted amino acid dehydrogenase